MRKIFTFLFAALMSVGMWADPTVVTWYPDDVFGSGSGTMFSKDGVTLNCTEIANGAIWCMGDPGTFTTTLGNFTKIEITTDWCDPLAGWEESSVIVGWDEEEEKEIKIPKWTWTGDAASVSFNGDFGGLSSIVFTIGPAAPAGPSWVREGDDWDDASKTLTVNSNLPDNAYKQNKEIEHVIISNGVTSIGANAFLNCWLTSVTIPYGVTSIGASAFYGCDELTSITIPNSVESIGNAAFCWCSSLPSITIPNSVTSIGGEAFRYCSGLTSVTIGTGVTSIGGYAFQSCTGLTSMVVANGNTNYDSRDNCNAIIETSTNKLIAGCQNSIIPNSVTSIGVDAFFSCGLTSITIPNSVTSIGEYAFFHCGLASVTIGDHVTSIGQRAFEGCSGLTSITCHAVTPPSLGYNVFASIANKSNIPLYVPFGSVAAYQATGWNEFNIQAMITPNVDPQNEDVYYCTVYDSQVKYALPEGVEAYVAALSGANLLLTKIAEAGQTIPADNAFILKSSVTPITLSPSEADAVTFSATNDLQGTDEEKAKPANCYVLSGEGGVVGFYQYNGAKVAAHKAYVVFSGSNNAPRRMPFIFDAATGVENVQGNVQSTKVLRDGQLIIIRNGVEYSVDGKIVK